MRSIRTMSIALLTAGTLAMTAAPAMAESSVDASGSSAVGEALGATDDERNIWGSSKDFDEVSAFGSAWYSYTLLATAAAIAGGVFAAIPALEQAGVKFSSL